MPGFEITGPYAAAMLMSLGALCIFIWGVLSGALSGVDEAAARFYRMEVGDDGKDNQTGRQPSADGKDNRPEDSPVHPELEVSESSHPELEEYAGGTIQARVGTSRHGCWSSTRSSSAGDYYMAVYWGGVGPGHLD